MATLSDLANTIKGLHVHSVENVFPDTQGNVDIEINKHNVGEEWHSYVGKVPVGGIAYLGQLVPKATYGALWAWVQKQDGLLKTEEEWQAIASTQNGNVPFYSTGDGDQHFRMPSIFGYIRGVGANDPAGTYIAEGLPNIAGSVGQSYESASINGGFHNYNNSGYGSGALYLDGTSYGSTCTQQNYGDAGIIKFDASRSNHIYGKSEHVTPETCMVLFGVWAFGEVTNIGQVELSDVVTDFENLRVDLSANKIDKTTPHITETWKSGTSWYRVWSDGWIEQGGHVDVAFGATVTVTLHLSMSNTNYTILEGSQGGSESTMRINPGQTTTSFRLARHYTGGAKGNGSAYWYVCGY